MQLNLLQFVSNFVGNCFFEKSFVNSLVIAFFKICQ